MYAFRYALLIPLFIVVSSRALAAPPPNIKEANAKQFYRMNLEDLKNFIPGVIVIKGHKGGKFTLTFKADGSVERTGRVDVFTNTGKWHFDKKNNAYCTALDEGAGYKETCFAVFRAPHGRKYFDYDIENSFYARKWHPKK